MSPCVVAVGVGGSSALAGMAATSAPRCAQSTPAAASAARVGAGTKLSIHGITCQDTRGRGMG